jgi:hypothetical protein
MRKLVVLSFITLDGVMQAPGGSGKRLFADGSFAGGFELIESRTSPAWVIIANYRRKGEVRTGSFS